MRKQDQDIPIRVLMSECGAIIGLGLFLAQGADCPDVLPARMAVSGTNRFRGLFRAPSRLGFGIREPGQAVSAYW